MIVLKEKCMPPDFDVKEILRYAGCKKVTEDMKTLAEECIKMCDGAFNYNVCWCEVPVSVKDGVTDLSFMQTDSKSLALNLSGSESAIVIAATIGMETDRLIKKYQHISPSKAVMFQAIGAERIEALCDEFNKQLKNKYRAENLYLKPRFSPGYGDFPLEAQRDIFRVLDCYRKIGVSLNESLLMSPSKSVTAIIGISKEKTECKNSCSLCEKTDCEFRSR